MSSQNTITGRHGKFQVGNQLVARTTKWGVNPTLANVSEWGDSDSGGYTNRAAGRRDATFDAEGKYDTTTPVFDLFAPEDVAEATLWLNNVSLYFNFPRALCSEFNLEVDIDTEEVIGWTSSWGSDGIFYRPGQDGAPSKTLPT